MTLFNDNFTEDDFDEFSLFFFGPDVDNLTVSDVLENGQLQQFVTQLLQRSAS